MQDSPVGSLESYQYPIVLNYGAIVYQAVVDPIPIFPLSANQVHFLAFLFLKKVFILLISAKSINRTSSWFLMSRPLAPIQDSLVGSLQSCQYPMVLNYSAIVYQAVVDPVPIFSLGANQVHFLAFLFLKKVFILLLSAKSINRTPSWFLTSRPQAPM